MNSLNIKIRNVVNKLIKNIRGSREYKMDPAISFLTIMGILSRKLICYIRSILRFFPPGMVIFIGSDVVIRSRNLLNLGKSVVIGNGVIIDALSKQGINIGNFTSIGEMSRLIASGTYTDLGKGITIGSNSSLGGFTFIGGAGGVRIGNEVIAGQWVSFHPENHNFDLLDIPIRLQGVSRKGIFIGDNCWIGAKATFLDGSSVGNGSVVAAGAVVIGPFPENSIIGGIPARIIGKRKSI